ncbi:MAG: hypothetical protein ACTSQY_00960 [Candidatus Odinarchaeia archaeon]
MKLYELVQAKPVLEKLFNTDLGVKTGWKLLKNLKKVNEYYKLFEINKHKLVVKYGKPTEDNPDMIKVTKENQNAYYKDFEDLLNEEINTVFGKVSLNEINNASLTTLELSSIEFLIKDK